ncbi:MAG TPA: DUF2914 domain-containing protein [Candidatus Paceibacterota bacterium]
MNTYDRMIKVLARHERVVSVATMIGGFCFDLVIAKRPDSVFVNTLLLVYLLVSAAVIVYLAASRTAPREKAATLAPILAMKFAFGGLSSNMLILYGKSGTLGGSLLFIGVLLAMLIGNEFLKSRYEELRFNMSVWYFLLLTYCVIAVPTWLTHEIGARTFIESNAISAALLLLFLAMLHGATRIFRGRDGVRHLLHALSMMAGILAVFNALYFAQLIPPVPLALRDGGIYHLVVRSADGSYGVKYEAAPWALRFWQNTNAIYMIAPAQENSAYCFSSVFAPTGLGASVEHVWQRYNTATNEWDTIATVSFPISGGREEGYRGYSMKSDLTPGRWRCNVETTDGSLVGRIPFDVIEGASPTLTSATL